MKKWHWALAIVLYILFVMGCIQVNKIGKAKGAKKWEEKMRKDEEEKQMKIKAAKDAELKDLEITFLRKRIEELEEEKRVERVDTLREVARKLASKNMPYPIIREIVGLPEKELTGVLYGFKTTEAAAKAGR